MSRRMIRTDLATPAEQKIREAIELVESLGCDERLTDAVALLSEALTEVGYFVDEQLEATLGE